MARFPTREADILALANEIESGIAANATVYPAPPFPSMIMSGTKNAYITANNASVAAVAAAEQKTAAKDNALESLTDMMRATLRYAENTVDFNDEKLKLLGWGGRKAKTSLETPGQARTLEAPRQGEGWIFLDWKEPSDGGKVAAYKVERRERPAGAWLDASMAIESEITLSGQERGKEFEYRIIAINKAGEGEPSNTVMAVL